MSQTFISVDVETDGPIPGRNSMLSIGAAAFTEQGEHVGTFYANLLPFPGARPDADTAEWWLTQPAAWQALQSNRREPQAVMQDFAAWVEGVSAGRGKPVFVGYPAGFDHLFVYWYQVDLLGTGPFTFSALDIKSYASAGLRLPFRDVNKRALAQYLPEDRPHTHVASDDAIEQGLLFLNLRKWFADEHQGMQDEISELRKDRENLLDCITELKKERDELLERLDLVGEVVAARRLF